MIGILGDIGAHLLSMSETEKGGSSEKRGYKSSLIIGMSWRMARPQTTPKEEMSKREERKVTVRLLPTSNVIKKQPRSSDRAASLRGLCRPSLPLSKESTIHGTKKTRWV
jgi:hypothetical protein